MAKTLTGSLRISSQFTLTSTAVNNANDISVPTNRTKSLTYTTGSGVSAGTGNQVFEAIRLISAGGYDVLDLAGGSLVNLVNDSGITFARVKAVAVTLLSPADDATYGNTCSGILVRPHSASPHKLFFNTTCSENNGGVQLEYGDTIGFGTTRAAGRGVSAGFGDSIYLGNQDGSVTAAVLITLMGADA